MLKIFEVSYLLFAIAVSIKCIFWLQFEIEPDQPYCTFNRESVVKVDGALQGSLKGIFDGGVRRVDTINIKALFGELCISEIKMQELLDKLQSR